MVSLVGNIASKGIVPIAEKPSYKSLQDVHSKTKKTDAQKND
jgi:hypothetical protein